MIFARFFFQMSMLNCSGLVTLSQFQLQNEVWSDLSKGQDYAKLTDVVLYAEYAITRKALSHTMKVNDTTIHLINTHFTQYNKKESENRDLRKQQASDVIQIGNVELSFKNCC